MRTRWPGVPTPREWASRRDDRRAATGVTSSRRRLTARDASRGDGRDASLGAPPDDVLVRVFRRGRFAAVTRRRRFGVDKRFGEFIARWFDRDASPRIDASAAVVVGMASGVRVAARRPEDVGRGRAPVGVERRFPETASSFRVASLKAEPSRVSSGFGPSRGRRSVPPGVRAAVASGEWRARQRRRSSRPAAAEAGLRRRQRRPPPSRRARVHRFSPDGEASRGTTL